MESVSFAELAKKSIDQRGKDTQRSVVELISSGGRELDEFQVWDLVDG